MSQKLRACHQVVEALLEQRTAVVSQAGALRRKTVDRAIFKRISACDYHESLAMKLDN